MQAKRDKKTIKLRTLLGPCQGKPVGGDDSFTEHIGHGEEEGAREKWVTYKRVKVNEEREIVPRQALLKGQLAGTQ